MFKNFILVKFVFIILLLTLAKYSLTIYYYIKYTLKEK